MITVFNRTNQIKMTGATNNQNANHGGLSRFPYEHDLYELGRPYIIVSEAD